MKHLHWLVLGLSIGPTLITSGVAAASDMPSVELAVPAGRPLRVRLDERIRIKGAGQPVSATVMEPVYAYDRVVVPVGSKLFGHIARLDGPGKLARVWAILNGDFTPRHIAVLDFDRLVLADRTQMAIATRVSSGVERVTLTVATHSPKPGVAARAKEKVTEKAKETTSAAKEKIRDGIAAITAPDKRQRLEEFAVNQLPYHPQYLHAGTVYSVELRAPLDFGAAPATERAPADATPDPESILKARLVTALDSSKTPRGTPLTAVLTEPVFSRDHRLILPEGTRLDGEVTFAKGASSLRRNGQLRFLIEGARVADEPRAELLASLYAVEASDDAGIAIDEEGGARVTNSKTRFIAPALAALAVQGSLRHDEHRRFDNDGDDNLPARSNGNSAARGVAGYLGFSAIGIAAGYASRPAAVALGIWGLARSTYSNVIAKGREVSFPADTPIEVQLSPNPPSRTK